MHELSDTNVVSTKVLNIHVNFYYWIDEIPVKIKKSEKKYK